MQISKSEYMMFLRQPAWLWLKKHDKSKLPPVDDNTQAIFDAGHAFEAYAESLFPGGVTIGFNNYNEYLSLPQRTQTALDDGATTIFQGRFEYEQITFICDIIEVIEGKTIDLYEIKSSTKAKPEHEFDLAFQMVVLEGCGYEVRNIKVIHVNNQYVRHGDVDPKDITGITDITEIVKAKREFTSENINAALEVVNSSTCPDLSPSLASQDSFGDWLHLYKHLAGVEEYSIYDLCLLNASTVSELERDNINLLVDIPANFSLKPKQQMQLEVTKTNTPIIKKAEIKEFLDSLIFPLYFFDYETLASTVPYFDGLKPYQQLPFQYSLHILDSPDAEVRHFEYLHRDKTNPAQHLSEVLQSQIGTHGSILAWNMSFEKRCNTLIGSLLPEYKEFYEGLNDRIVDLMLPFSSCLYVDKGFLGSASIKHVLPVLVPELSYKVLGIQEGTAAQRLWMEAVLDGKRDGEKEKILSDLVEYCGLDTMAMVKIYEILKSL